MLELFCVCVIHHITNMKIYLDWHRPLPLLLFESGFAGIPGVVLGAALVGHCNVGREGVSYEANCSGFGLVHWCVPNAVAIRQNVLLLCREIEWYVQGWTLWCALGFMNMR